MAYEIGPNCSTCHYCFNTCPVGAIKFVGVEYAIDPHKCINCGACAKVCPAGIITNPELEEKPVPHEPEEMTCDAVVLGAGGSGLVAAVRYKQLTGKNVVVLEKSRKVGGNTNLGHAFVVRYSKLHEKAGLPDQRPQAIESIWNGSDGPEMSRNLLTKAMYSLSDMFDWLCEFGGVEENFKLVDLREHPINNGPFVCTPGYFDFPNRTQNKKSNDHSMGPGWMGTYVVEKMMEQCRKMGIPVLTQHRGVRLNVDAEGVFQSVEVENPGGKLTVHAKCILLASGGFSHNDRIMKKIHPSYFEGLPCHSFTVASNTGDAIDMAEEIGAKLDFKHIKSPLFGPIHHPFNYGVVSLVNDPRIAMVNINGRRFKNEGEPPKPGEPTGPLENQPMKMAYAVFDNATAEKMGADLLARTRNNPGLYQGMVTWREQLEYECAELDIAAQKADTIAELAREARISEAGLVDEVEKYNMFCHQGRDEDFDKPVQFLSPIEKGPFYAVLLLRFNEGSEGGLVNDDDLRLVREDGKPFTGIYVAGDTCRGVLKHDDEGGKFGEMPWAMASGFMAGQEMADFTR